MTVTCALHGIVAIGVPPHEADQQVAAHLAELHEGEETPPTVEATYGPEDAESLWSVPQKPVEVPEDPPKVPESTTEIEP